MASSGKVIYEIVSSQRNGEGAFFDMPDGRLAYVYSHCTGAEFSDDSPSSIAVIYSSDSGNTWTDEEAIVSPQEHDALNVMSVSLLQMENGDIGLFYLIRYGWHDTRLHLRRSADGGSSWGPVTCCIPAPGYFVTNNDRVVRLSTGRIVVPANFHRMRGEDVYDWSSWDSRSLGLFYLSDDDGASWREATQWCCLSDPSSRTGLHESGLIELLGGTLWAWFRTDRGHQYESFSRDQGETWTVPGPSRFSAPASPMSMKRLGNSGRLIAVWNPTPSRGIGSSLASDRTPLVYATSKDDGTTWSDPVVMEDDDQAGYSYISIHPTKASVLLAYFVQRHGETNLPKRGLRMRELPLNELA